MAGKDAREEESSALMSGQADLASSIPMMSTLSKTTTTSSTTTTTESGRQEARTADEALKILLGQTTASSSAGKKKPSAYRSALGYFRMRASHVPPNTSEKENGTNKAPQVRRSLDDALKKIAISRERLAKLVSAKPKKDADVRKLDADVTASPQQNGHRAPIATTLTSATSVTSSATVTPSAKVTSTLTIDLGKHEPDQDQNLDMSIGGERRSRRPRGLPDEGYTLDKKTLPPIPAPKPVVTSHTTTLNHQTTTGSGNKSATVQIPKTADETIIPPKLPSSSPPKLPQNAQNSPRNQINEAKSPPPLPVTSPPPLSEVKSEPEAHVLSRSKDSKHEDRPSKTGSTRPPAPTSSEKPGPEPPSRNKPHPPMDDTVTIVTEMKNSVSKEDNGPTLVAPAKSVPQAASDSHMTVTTTTRVTTQQPTVHEQTADLAKATLATDMITKAASHSPDGDSPAKSSSAPWRSKSPSKASPDSASANHAATLWPEADTGAGSKPILFGTPSQNVSEVRNKMRQNHWAPHTSSSSTHASASSPHVSTSSAHASTEVTPQYNRRPSLDDLYDSHERYIVEDEPTLEVTGEHGTDQSIEETMKGLDKIRAIRRRLTSSGEELKHEDKEPDKIADRYAKTEEKVMAEILKIREKTMMSEALFIDKSLHKKSASSPGEHGERSAPLLDHTPSDDNNNAAKKVQHLYGFQESGHQDPRHQDPGQQDPEEQRTPADVFRKNEMEKQADSLNYFRYKTQQADYMCNAKIDRLLSGVGQRYTDYQSSIIDNYIKPTSKTATQALYGEMASAGGRASRPMGRTSRYQRSHSTGRHSTRDSSPGPRYYSTNPFEV